MIASLRQFLRGRHAAPRPGIPPGQRVYAIGDIHGRRDLLAVLIAAVEADDAARNAEGQDGTPAETTIILLGDLIDRGPESAGVLALAHQWQMRRRVRILMGNHEETLLAGLDDLNALRQLMRYGGRETVLSFGVDPDTYDNASWEELQAIVARAIPPQAFDFMRGFEDSVRIGDYFFVHAGVLPGVPLEAQRAEDTRWIREPFLSSTDSHGAVIVHGHTITDEPVLRFNRIGIDTGAFRSGRLTALGLEGTERWLIETRDEGNAITAHGRPAG